MLSENEGEEVKALKPGFAVFLSVGILFFLNILSNLVRLAVPFAVTWAIGPTGWPKKIIVFLFVVYAMFKPNRSNLD